MDEKNAGRRLRSVPYNPLTYEFRFLLFYCDHYLYSTVHFADLVGYIHKALKTKCRLQISRFSQGKQTLDPPYRILVLTPPEIVIASDSVFQRSPQKKGTGGCPNLQGEDQVHPHGQDRGAGARLHARGLGRHGHP